MKTIAPQGAAGALRGFEELSRADVPWAGGKGATLGELVPASPVAAAERRALLRAARGR